MSFSRQRYLQPSRLCDFDRSPEIRRKALELTASCRNRKERFNRLFDFVKEMPYGLEDWDLKASETLKKGWGMCSGKTNLLVALLRSISIPARYRIYRIKADTVLWDRAGTMMTKAARLKEMGEERDHVDCEVWLDRWIECDAGRDAALEKGILKLGGRLKRKTIADSRGKVHYLRLAIFDDWARSRQAGRKFRSDRAEVFAQINSGFEKLRELGRS